ncbi:MAG: hypothetical protein KF891_03675 [Rhizobacter sp.]|nr:hypothetical protein [Rhizobacter sp.]
MKKRSKAEVVSPLSTESLIGMEVLLPDVRTGDQDALDKLLLVISEALKQGVLLSPGLATFLSDALDAIRAGEDPKEAFYIHRGRGRGDTKEAAYRALQLAWLVCEARRPDPKTGKRATVEEAVYEVHEEQGVPEDTVKAAWRDYRKQVELSAEPGGAFVNFERRVKPRKKIQKINKKSR